MSRDPTLNLRDTRHRRLFWRVRARLAERWWEVPDREVRKYLRMCSWRRAL